MADLRSLAIGACAAAAALVGSDLAPAAVFGTDDRVAVPVRHRSLNKSIGLFYNTKARTVCSAFCVADNVVATASHCIFKTAGEAPLDPADFRFSYPHMPASRQARVAGAETGTASHHVIAGNMRLNIKPPIDASQDWALVRLDRPVCRGALLPVVPMSGADVAARARMGQVFQVAFHRDRLPWRLLYAAGCRVEPTFDRVERSQIERDFRNPSNLLLHRCGTGGASSGSPLLAETRDGPVVVGINVGTYVQSRVMLQDGAVTYRSQPEPIANTAVNATAFAADIRAFISPSRHYAPVNRSSRLTSSALSGGTAASGAVRLLRHNTQPLTTTSSTGVDHSRTVDGVIGGRSSTNAP